MVNVQEQNPAYLIDAVAKALEVLGVFDGSERLTLVDVSKRVGLNKTRVFRLLHTLAAFGYIERSEDDRRFSLGLKLFERAGAVRLDLRKIALPIMQGLHRKFNETVNLGLIDADEVLYLEILESGHSFKVATSVGRRSHIHSSSLGKAIAAFLNEDQIKALLPRKRLVKRTERTITDSEKIKAELEEVRRKGYAFDNQEDVQGAACVGAPIFDKAGNPVAAISISGPTSRVLQRREEMATSLMAACNKISRQLGFSGNQSHFVEHKRLASR